MKIFIPPENTKDYVMIEESSGLGLIQKTFWTGYKKYLERHKSDIKFTPRALSYINIEFKPNFHYSARTLFNGAHDNVEALIDLPTDRIYFDKMVREKDTIEEEFGEKLQWGIKRTRWNILVGIDVDLWDQNNWQDTYQWLMEKMTNLDQVFRKRFKVI